ncbi:MAG: hypothetical protein ABI681_12700 [Gemmatimonadales bacterium]
MSKAVDVRPEDVASIESIIATDYELISDRADEPRDWHRMRTLFHPNAHLIPIERDSDGKVIANVMTLDEFIKSRTPLLAAGAFYEWETAREERREGRMAHVWSSYEAARAPGGESIRRGVNSIQLWNDGSRWWILSITWDAISAAQIQAV